MLWLLSNELNYPSMTKGVFVWGEKGRIENFGDKIGKETFLKCVWLSGEEGK